MAWLDQCLALSFRGPAFRALGAVAWCASAGGCASVKEMTDDFGRRWDNPQSIMEEMEGSADANRALGDAAPTTADLGECASLAGPAASAEEDNRAGALLLAECLLEHARDGEARKYFAALAERSDDADALQGLGIADLRLKDFASAQTSLERAVSLDPSLWRAWNALGVVYDETGRTEDAWTAYARAGEINPSEGAPLNNLGVSYLKAGEMESAIAALKDAMAHEGARDAAEANLRLAYAMSGDYEHAVKSLPDSKRAAALNNAGFAAAMRGDNAEARRLFMKALDESPNFYAKAYNNMTLLLD